jgi:hypothetical protein
MQQTETVAARRRDRQRLGGGCARCRRLGRNLGSQAAALGVNGAPPILVLWLREGSELLLAAGQHQLCSKDEDGGSSKRAMQLNRAPTGKRGCRAADDAHTQGAATRRHNNTRLRAANS